MGRNMKYFDAVAEAIAALSIIAGGAFLIGWSSIL